MVRRREPALGVGEAARLAAFEVLRAVDAGVTWGRAWDRTGALVRAKSRERRFAHELASGCLRLQSRLDWFLGACSTRPLASLDPGVTALLRLGAYQLVESSAVREHAAVHSTVELTKRCAPRAAGFVNAVLRAVVRVRPTIVFPDPQREPLAFLSTHGSHPEWLVGRWLERFGPDATRSLCERDNRRPELCLRVNRRRTTREGLLQALPGSVPGRWSEDAVHCPSPRYAAVRGVVERGEASVQDESAMLVAPLLGPKAGSRWLDLAAAPGGKACHLAELAGDGGTVFAFDRSASRLERLRANATRLGLDNVVATCADARTLLPPPADGVLLDAPCTGLGVLARRPDLRWRKRAADLERLAGLQSELLEAAAQHVPHGGRLVYSVCSFEPEETTEVAARFRASHPDFEPEDEGMPETLRSGPGLRYFLPQEHGVDGGFVARWRRRG